MFAGAICTGAFLKPLSKCGPTLPSRAARVLDGTRMRPTAESKLVRPYCGARSENSVRFYVEHLPLVVSGVFESGWFVPAELQAKKLVLRSPALPCAGRQFDVGLVTVVEGGCPGRGRLRPFCFVNEDARRRTCPRHSRSGRVDALYSNCRSNSTLPGHPSCAMGSPCREWRRRCLKETPRSIVPHWTLLRHAAMLSRTHRLPCLGRLWRGSVPGRSRSIEQ